MSYIDTKRLPARSPEPSRSGRSTLTLVALLAFFATLTAIAVVASPFDGKSLTEEMATRS